MDPEKKPALSNRSESDADIGLLLYKTGASLKALLMWAVGILTNLANAVLFALVFVLRNIVWLILGAAVGIGYGMYLSKKNGTQYHSEMTLRANFSSARSLYNAVDYLNALIATKNTNELSRFFSISPPEALQLKNFSAEPVKSELIIADLYKSKFLDNDRTVRIRQDTFWVRTVTYGKFKESLTNVDYPYHVVSATSTNSAIFSKLQLGIQNYLASNTLLREIKSSQDISNEGEVKLLTSAIQSIDSLRQAYSARIATGQPNPGSNQVNISQSTPELKAPELEIYDKMLELQEELDRSRERSLTENDIIEVYSPFNPVGRKFSFFNQNAGRFGIIGCIMTFLILLAIAIIRSPLIYSFVAKKKAPK